MNMCVVTGVLPEKVELKDGTYGAYCCGSLVSRRNDKSMFVPYVAYGEMADRLTRIQPKSKLSIVGYLDTYKDKENNYKLSINIRDFELIAGAEEISLINKKYW